MAVNCGAIYYRLNDGSYGSRSSRDSGGKREYFHENIIYGDLMDHNSPPVHEYCASNDYSTKLLFGILGYASDEGVKQNKGRVGARDGPNKIRTELAKLSVHLNDETLRGAKFPVIDFGNVHPMWSRVEEFQKGFTEFAGYIQGQNMISIGLGGGHDMAYAHFKALRKREAQSLKVGEDACIGILNFDAHFDLRPPVDQNGRTIHDLTEAEREKIFDPSSEEDTFLQSTSGTPFNQILMEAADVESKISVKYFVVGIQRQANARSLYKIAEDYGVKYIPAEECTISNIYNIESSILECFKDCKAVYITCDLDGFTSMCAPGVSAPGVFGFSPEFFKSLFTRILHSLPSAGVPIKAMDIAELNPQYDIDCCTARLAAQIVNVFVETLCNNAYTLICNNNSSGRNTSEIRVEDDAESEMSRIGGKKRGRN